MVPELIGAIEMFKVTAPEYGLYFSSLPLFIATRLAPMPTCDWLAPGTTCPLATYVMAVGAALMRWCIQLVCHLRTH